MSVATLPYGSEAWVLARRDGVGASEMGAIAGVDPYKGEYALALEKRGESEPFEGNAATRWGHVIETLALDYLEREQGHPIIRGETFHASRHPHVWATLDGRYEDEGYEVKATTRWTDPPQHVLLQAYAQMGCADLARVHVVRVSPYGEPQITTVERDDAIVMDLLDLAEAWYLRFVEGGDMPPPDGSRAAMRYLDRFRGEEERQATDVQATLAETLRHIRTRRDDLESQEHSVIAALKASMAGTGVLVGTGWRIAWQAVKGRTSTDWKSVAASYRRELEDLMEPEELDAVEGLHTSTGEPGTRFVPTFEEEPT